MVSSFSSGVFLNFPVISSVTYWLFRSGLFNFHMLVSPQIPFFDWLLMSLHCSQKALFCMVSFFKVHWGLFYDLICVCLFWRMVRVCLRRMYIWLLFGGVLSASTPGWSARRSDLSSTYWYTLGRLLWSWGYIYVTPRFLQPTIRLQLPSRANCLALSRMTEWN